MSKLSDAVREIEREEVKISRLKWQTYAREVAQAILDLNFEISKVENSVYLFTHNTTVKLAFAVKINFDAKTTAYDIYAYSINNDLFDAIEKGEGFAVYTTSNLTGKDEEVDIGELKTYIESVIGKSNSKETLDIIKTKNVGGVKVRIEGKLNEEIDNGFKNDRRAKLGGETLENDIAFNEYLHRKFGKLV